MLWKTIANKTGPLLRVKETPRLFYNSFPIMRLILPSIALMPGKLGNELRTVEKRVSVPISLSLRELSLSQDDDDIELALKVRLTGNKLPVEDDIPPIVDEESFSDIHGLTATGDAACCKRAGLGVVDCAKCLDQVHSQVLAGFDDSGAKQVGTIIDTVCSRGSAGVGPRELHVRG